ncbi:MAG: M28 family peptidase [Nitrospira sp.]|nr:M28 family peptidase [Nitrospira sp.]MDH4243946.1 M28 family peptidase [Nitrospira sp.]MDH4356687.1 M28 family peptidase [Nitrospira sp.]MDH5317046.1 M28 family peptidase [Nitrospira sp.]
MPVDRHRLEEDLHTLVGERHPLTSPNHLQQAEAYLRRQFSEAGLVVTTHDFEALGGTYRNVIATAHPASTHGELPPLIIGAHFDTVAGSPGADDNASALAVLLHVARQVRGMMLSRPIRFIAFNLEEENLLGSSAYVSFLKENRETIHGAIILECVGYASHQQDSQKTPPGLPISIPTTGDFIGVIGNERSQALTGFVVQAMKSHLPTVPLVVLGNGELLPDTRRSDHTSFWEQGFPAVMLTDTANFRNPHYHQPTDTLDTLNLDFLASVAEGVTAAVSTLACQQST